MRGSSEADRRVDWRWLDRISEVNADCTEAKAHRYVGASEWYFEYHFEHFPVVPGVLLVEMMGHAAGHLCVLRALQNDAGLLHFFLAGTNNTRFYRPVLPDSQIDLVASLRQGDDDQVLLQTSASVNDQRVARSQIMLHRVEGDWLKAQDALLEGSLKRVLAPDLRARFGLQQA